MNSFMIVSYPKTCLMSQSIRIDVRCHFAIYQTVEFISIKLAVIIYNVVELKFVSENVTTFILTLILQMFLFYFFHDYTVSVIILDTLSSNV